MIGRRTVLGAAAGVAIGAALQRPAYAAPSAADRMNQLGPENEALRSRVGLWDMTETVWSGPGAEPVSTTGLVAERVMMGSLLQELLRPADDRAHAAVARTDMLSFDRIEGCWKYVSFDTRAPVGLMPAVSTGPGDGRTIELIFEPFAAPLPGDQVIGQMLRMTQIIRFEAPDRDVKDQYFMLADGTGTRWLAHRYAYVRRG